MCRGRRIGYPPHGVSFLRLGIGVLIYTTMLLFYKTRQTALATLNSYLGELYFADVPAASTIRQSKEKGIGI